MNGERMSGGVRAENIEEVIADFWCCEAFAAIWAAYGDEVPAGRGSHDVAGGYFCGETASVMIVSVAPGVGERRPGHSRGQEERQKAPATVRGRYISEGPNGRKYWVPFTGSWRRRRSCWRSELRSTKSMSEVLMTRRSEAA